jgi:hypothetical protein
MSAANPEGRLEKLISGIAGNHGFWIYYVGHAYLDVAQKLIEKGFSEEEAVDMLCLLYNVTSDQPDFNEIEGLSTEEMFGRIELMTRRPGFAQAGSADVFKSAAQQVFNKGFSKAEVLAIMESIYEAGTVYHGSFESRCDVDARLVQRGFSEHDASELSFSVYQVLSLPNWSEGMRFEMQQ